jgi:LacI family transcriptional regulator
MGKKIKNKDLAARLGVSCTLVSLVLNNKADLHGIKKDTQEKVLSLARQMGYFNSTAEKDSFPVEETPGVIGMIVPSCHDPFIYEIAPFLQKSFSSIGIGFSLITKEPDDQRFSRMISAFKKFYSGLILVGEAADENTIRALRSTDYPFVLLEKNVSKLRLNTVTTDTTAGASLVAAHIEKLGYRNVLLVTDQKGINHDEYLISQILRALAERKNINRPEIAAINVPIQNDELDFTAVEKFLRPPYSTQLLVILHADLVYPVMAELQRRKIRVPHDLALISMEEGIGFDLLHSPVTSLKRPLAGLALKVSNMIWTEVKNAGKSKYKRQVNLSPELIIRSSCGNP